MAYASIYWTNINDDIEKQVKFFSTCLDFQQTQPKKDNTSQNSSQTMGDSWHRYVNLTQ